MIERTEIIMKCSKTLYLISLAFGLLQAESVIESSESKPDVAAPQDATHLDVFAKVRTLSDDCCKITFVCDDDDSGKGKGGKGGKGRRRLVMGKGGYKNDDSDVDGCEEVCVEYCAPDDDYLGKDDDQSDGKGAMMSGKGNTMNGKGGMTSGKGGMISGKGGMISGKGGMISGKGGMTSGKGVMVVKGERDYDDEYPAYDEYPGDDEAGDDDGCCGYIEVCDYSEGDGSGKGSKSGIMGKVDRQPMLSIGEKGHDDGSGDDGACKKVCVTACGEGVDDYGKGMMMGGKGGGMITMGYGDDDSSPGTCYPADTYGGCNCKCCLDGYILTPHDDDYGNVDYSDGKGGMMGKVGRVGMTGRDYRIRQLMIGKGREEYDDEYIGEGYRSPVSVCSCDCEGDDDYGKGGMIGGKT